MAIFFTGFAVSLSLIVAIGAQNAFVLRQGIRNRHIGAVVLTCVLSEAILITSGVVGFGALSRQFPAIEPISRWGGALFLVIYGALSMRRAFISNNALEARGKAEQSVAAAVLTCLALIWLNPHVYLDTVILLGTIAGNYGADRWVFGAGALSASTVFFIVLGYGAASLQPWFAKPRAWRILDAAVGLLMWFIAATLVLT